MMIGGAPESVPFGSTGERMSLFRSTGPPGSGGAGRSLVPVTGINGSFVGLAAAVVVAVPVTWAMASPACPATSVRLTRTLAVPVPVNLNCVDPSASGRVGTEIQLAPLVEYSSRNFDQSGFFSMIFQTTVTSSPVRWALAMLTTGFLVSKRTFRAGDALNKSAGSRRPDLSTMTMLNQ